MRSRRLTVGDSMWCEHCRLDVAAVVTEQEISCHRCQLPLPRRSAKTAIPTTVTTEAVLSPSLEAAPTGRNDWSDRPCLADSWEMDEELRHFGRLLKVDAPHAASESRPASGPESPSRAFIEEPTLEAIYGRDTAPKAPTLPRQPSFRWPAIWLGLMALSCGGVLLALAHFGNRPDLRPIGLPSVIAGATGLILGAAIRRPARRAEHRPAEIAETAIAALSLDIDNDWSQHARDLPRDGGALKNLPAVPRQRQEPVPS